jgi:hypothetical protein
VIKSRGTGCSLLRIWLLASFSEEFLILGSIKLGEKFLDHLIC